MEQTEEQKQEYAERKRKIQEQLQGRWFRYTPLTREQVLAKQAAEGKGNAKN